MKFKSALIVGAATLAVFLLIPTKMLPTTSLNSLQRASQGDGLLVREFFNQNLILQAQEICVKYGTRTAHSSEFEHFLASEKRSLLGDINYMGWSILLKDQRGDVLQAFVVSSDVIDLRTRERPPRNEAGVPEGTPLDCAPVATAKLFRFPSKLSNHYQFILSK